MENNSWIHPGDFVSAWSKMWAILNIYIFFNINKRSSTIWTFHEFLSVTFRKIKVWKCIRTNGYTMFSVAHAKDLPPDGPKWARFCENINNGDKQQPEKNSLKLKNRRQKIFLEINSLLWKWPKMETRIYQFQQILILNFEIFNQKYGSESPKFHF